MRLALKLLGVAAAGFLLIVGVPILINEIYNIGGYVTHWGASEVLGYYGSILGGFATLLAIYFTIRHENKKMRAENARRENERKRELAIQRLNFVSSNLRFMLSKIDNSPTILNTFKNNISIWNENPQEIYKFFNETSSVINTNTAFTADENELIEDEFEELQNYAKAHSNLLWEMYSLLVDYKTLKTVSESNERMQELIRDRNRSCMTTIEKLQKGGFSEWSKEKELATNDILQEVRENLDKSDEIDSNDKKLRTDLEDIFNSIMKLPEKFDELYNNKYEHLLPAVKDAEKKIKEKIEVMPT